MIGTGGLSINAAVDIASSVVADHEVPHAAIKAFSSLGTSGEHPQNAERDLFRWFKKCFWVTAATLCHYPGSPSPLLLDLYLFFSSSRVSASGVTHSTLHTFYSDKNKKRSTIAPTVFNSFDEDWVAILNIPLGTSEVE